MMLGAVKTKTPDYIGKLVPFVQKVNEELTKKMTFNYITGDIS